MSDKAFMQGPGSLLDYVAWRGDLSFGQDPFNDADGLLTAVMAYANFGENERTFDNPQRMTVGDLATSDVLTRYPQCGLQTGRAFRKRLFEVLPGSPRFSGIRILDQVSVVDPFRCIQFSALTLRLPQAGTVIAFRGTDQTATGWKEDFMMSYTVPVPAQKAALDYLHAAAERTEGDLILTGHSKGGNLSLYAAAHADEAVQDRLKAVYSFDGPGLDDGTMASSGYQRIRGRIHSVIPEGSVVGLLMNYHPVYRVAGSNASGIMQHEPATWLLQGRQFSEREKVAPKALVLDKTLHDWLNRCTPGQRQVFVNTVFSIFEKKKDERSGGPENEMDETSRRMVLSLLYRLLSIHAGNTYALRIRKPVLQAAERLTERLKEKEDTRVISRTIPVDNRGEGFEQVLEETADMSRRCGLDGRERIRLQLFAEEMISMIRTISGDMQGTFWIERDGSRYELHLSARTAMDKEKRKTLIASSASRKNAAARSFLGRLRDVFEKARMSGREDVYLDMSLADAQKRRRAWDRYEQSVLLRLADDVRIAIRGDTVDMTVSRVFTSG